MTASIGKQVTLDGTIYLNPETFSVTEDSTPTSPADTTGGVGQFTASVPAPDAFSGGRNLKGKEAELQDGSQGITVGTITGLGGGDDGTLSVTADARLGKLNVERTAQPFTGTLDNWFDYILGLVGITGGVVVDTTIASRAVVYPGFTGNVWDYLKKMCVAEQVEVSLVSNNVVLRPLRGRIAENYRNSVEGWSLNDSQLAQSVEVAYFQNTYQTGVLAYPDGGWNEDVQVENAIEAGTTATYNYPINASLMSVVQPTCVSSVDRYESSSSVYSVIGNDNLIVPPAEWAAGGGSLTVAVGADTKSIDVTIVTSSDTEYAPYTIAMSAGASSNYSSLRILGTGVFQDRQVISVKTGVDPVEVPTLVGFAPDIEFINTREQAYHLALHLLKSYGTAKHTITVTTSGINRNGDTGSYAYPTIAQFNDLYAGQDVGDFNALFSGMTIEEFNDAMYALVENDFTNQAFGNVAGARVRFADAWFRIRTATIDQDQIVYTAEEDTTIADFNDVWAGATIADFNTQWSGKTMADFVVAPLWRG